jgi:hypothetical protein
VNGKGTAVRAQTGPPLPEFAALVPSKGKTRARVAAEALGLRKGAVFRLDQRRYKRLMQDGPFEKSWVTIVPHPDGKVRLPFPTRPCSHPQPCTCPPRVSVCVGTRVGCSPYCSAMRHLFHTS